MTSADSDFFSEELPTGVESLEQVWLIRDLFTTLRLCKGFFALQTAVTSDMEHFHASSYENRCDEQATVAARRVPVAG